MSHTLPINPLINGTLSASSINPVGYNLQFFGSNSKEIVRLNVDGTVTWANGINIDEAAKAFSISLAIGAEMKIGITNRVKCEIRDRIFESIIELAKKKGPLTSEDLTYLLESSKIVEKIKGITD